MPPAQPVKPPPLPAFSAARDTTKYHLPCRNAASPALRTAKFVNQEHAKNVLMDTTFKGME